jgi:SAM-dependent methyltransferase
MGFLSGLHWELYVQALILICAVTFTYYTWRTKIPLVPTQAAARNAVMTVLQAEFEARLDKKIKIYDLGSGLGGLCRTIARRFPDAEVIGIEMAWPIWLFAFARLKLRPRKNLQFLFGDFWKYDISDGDIVVFYLGDVVMAMMAEKLRNEARPNRLIVSNTFPLPKDWAPIQRIPIAAWLSKEIFVYRQVG